MEHLMDEIQHIGNIESNTQEEHCESITSICQEILHEFRDFEIAFEITPHVEGYGFSISCEKFCQILQNLIKNAISFSPEKGSISLAIHLEANFLILRIADRGPGIREEVFPHIRNRFFTYRPNSDEKHSGLGLSIIDAILRTCGGQLEYRNRNSGGAEFTCRIPAYQE